MDGLYCSECGQRALRSDEYSLRRLVREGLRDAFSLDAKLWKSFSGLFAHPGEPTAAYMRGARAGHLGPLQIFLVANLIYFFVQPYTGFNGFNTPLESHISRQFYSGAAGIRVRVLDDIEERVDLRVAMERTRRGGSWSPTDSLTVRDRAQAIESEVYPTEFDASGEVFARSLVILLVPLVAAAVALLFVGTGKPAVQHVVFSIHVVAWQLTFLMSLFFPLLLFVTRGSISVVGGYLGVPVTEIYSDPLWGNVIRLVLENGALAVEAPYFYLALRRVYGGGRLAAGFRAAALLVALLGATIIFRCALFWLTYLSV